VETAGILLDSCYSTMSELLKPFSGNVKMACLYRSDVIGGN